MAITAHREGNNQELSEERFFQFLLKENNGSAFREVSILRGQNVQHSSLRY